jgi:hypothetical protein
MQIDFLGGNMKRRSYMYVGAACMIGLGWFIWSWIAQNQVSLMGEANLAQRTIQELSAAEERCKSVIGYYVQIDKLNSRGCGGIRWLDGGQVRDGFTIEIATTSKSYEITLRPLSKNRIMIYSSDERGQFHSRLPSQ